MIIWYSPFRFMDQLGSAAQKSVQTVIVNTLASSDYGLLDEETFTPRPNYWGALLWKRTMDSKVLDPGPSPNSEPRLYAQCMLGVKGGVSLLVLNLNLSVEQNIQIPSEGEQFTLSATELSSGTVLLNGVALEAAPDGTVPDMPGQPLAVGLHRF